MSLRARAALPALLALAVTLTLAASGALAASPVQGDAAAQGAPSVDRTVFFVQLEPDGDATWEVTHHTAVYGSEDREAFTDLAERYENGEFDLAALDVIRRAAERADDATGRNMSVTDVERTSDVDNGTLTLSLTWQNFARQEGDAYYVGDAFDAGDEPWLSGLTEDQTLIMAVPDGYGIRSAPKRHQDGRVRWEGPQEFTAADLSLTYIGNGPGASPSESPGTSSPEDPDDRNAIVWGGFLVLGLVVVGAYVLSRRDGGAVTAGPLGGAPEGEATPADESAVTDPDPDPVDDVDEELLSDEERVERLLERNGGRMKQADIVKETDWSNAKVSQLLSSMEEEGRIDKLRIGRENLISFPDEDLTDLEE
ncbi:helix-turn-helix transcriptional regulator [Halomicrobium salinisoli]|uniref:helix-turn-helix transcriptional regulator n=1 Tax=Halomicrobium salinisoli TaxID=2878391 RepID=UPI001CF03EA7|nr:hypothetical protein [Halomicrobium salinisoli]